MLKISRESEINLINVLIDNDIISGKDLVKIKKVSTEGNKSQIDAVFELKLTDEERILDLLVKDQSLAVVDLSTMDVSEEVKTILPSNYVNMNFIAPFKVEGNTLHIAIGDISKLSLMRNLRTITKKEIELHAARISHISDFIDKIINAGSVFIGNFTPESAGDYASGTNHTLPTNGYSRQYSGVNLDSYLKAVTFQKITPKGLSKLGPMVEKMASAEGLEAHRNAISIRLKSL